MSADEGFTESTNEEETVTEARVTEFPRFMVLQDSLTHRTASTDPMDGHEILGFCATRQQAEKMIKDQCRRDVDGWHEFSTGPDDFFSRYGIFELVTQVQPTLKIVAQIGYPYEDSEVRIDLSRRKPTHTQTRHRG